MVREYWHIMIVQGVAADDNAQDADGNFVPQQQPEPTQQKCRYEPLAAVKEFLTADGNIITTKGTIYMPRNAAEITNGVMIEVIGRVTAKALYFQRNAFNCTLYV